MRLAAIMEHPVIMFSPGLHRRWVKEGHSINQSSKWHSTARAAGIITLGRADATEVTAAMAVIRQRRHEPAALVLSRQALPIIDAGKYVLRVVAKGAPIGGFADGETEQ